MRPSHLLAAVAAFLLAAPVAANAADWKSGDVFVGTSTGQYNVYSNAGTLLESIDQNIATTGTREAVDCGFDRSGVLYTTAFRFSRLARFLGPAPHNQISAITTGDRPESIAFARDGSFYVGHQANPNSLLRFNSAGTQTGAFSPASPASLIDLSADQRTIFYTDRSTSVASKVHRFDVAANKDLPDFSDPGGTGRLADLKLLPPGDGSGGALLAQTTEIKRLDGAGKVVQTYDRAGEDSWFGIALDPDGKSFWAQTNSPGNVFRFNIASGDIDRGPLPAASSAFGICVNGSRTAALDNAAPSISITTPADGATFQQGQDVRADYRCTDDGFGTGIESCTGTAAPGGPLDTSTPGTKTFRVDAVDKAGNTASATRTFRVVPPPPPVAPPAPPAPPERISIGLSTGFPDFRTTPKFTLLIVRNVPAGATVKATCRTKRHRRCPHTRDFIKRNVRGGDIKLRGFLRKRFPAGSVLEVRVTKPGAIGAVRQIKIRNRKRPRSIELCLPPGAKKPQKRC